MIRNYSVPAQHLIALEADKHIARCFERLSVLDFSGCRYSAQKAITLINKINNNNDQMIEILLLAGQISKCLNICFDNKTLARVSFALDMVEKLVNEHGHGVEIDLNLEQVLDILTAVPVSKHILEKALKSN